MLPWRSIASDFPSGEAATDIDVPSVTVTSIVVSANDRHAVNGAALSATNPTTKTDAFPGFTLASLARFPGPPKIVRLPFFNPPTVRPQ